MIQLTAFGALFACLLGAILLLRPRWLPALLPLAAVMQAPAVVVLAIGAQRLGITPFNLMMAATGGVLLARAWRDPRVARAAMRRGARSLWPYFLAYSVLAALVLPWLSQGVPVQPLLAEGDVNPLMPLPNAPSLSHLAQAVNALGGLVVLLYLFSERDRHGQLRIIAGGLVAALAATVLIGAYQRGSMLGAYPLASAFWGSNPTYNQWFLAPDYGPYFGRAALPFIEPSYASVWFASMAAAAFTAAVHAARRWMVPSLALLVAALAGLANTVGTSGFAALAVFGAVFFVHFLVHGRRVAPPQGRWIVAGATLATLALAGAVAADHAAWKTPALAPVRGAIDFTLAKTQDLASNVRFLADLRALEIFFETHGLGAGPGSTRASSYLMGLLANGGLAGVLLFAAAAARTLTGAHALAMRGDLSACLALGGAVGVLIGAIAAISDQNWPVLWTLLFFAAACARVAFSDAMRRPPGAPPPPA